MAAFKNIDPFTFLGIICSIFSNENITAGEKINYFEGLNPIEIPGIGQAVPPLSLPSLPKSPVIGGSSNGKPDSDLYWYYFALFSVLLIGVLIITYIFWKEKKEKKEAMQRT